MDLGLVGRVPPRSEVAVGDWTGRAATTRACASDTWRATCLERHVFVGGDVAWETRWGRVTGAAGETAERGAERLNECLDMTYPGSYIHTHTLMLVAHLRQGSGEERGGERWQ